MTRRAAVLLLALASVACGARSAPVIAPVVAVAAPHVSAGHVYRVTDASDGEIIPRMYSYWANAWVSGTVAHVFAGTSNGPRFFDVDLASGAVTRRGNLIDYGGTTEGWFWNARGQITLTDGPRLRRVNPFVPSDDVVVLDITTTHPACDLWQAHSSDDGETHSATVRQITSEGAYQAIGTIVVRHGQREFVAAIGSLDESQVTSDGAYLVIKETIDGLLVNRVIELSTGIERRLANWGAVGHSDVGASLLIGESSPQQPGGLPAAAVAYDLTQPLTPTNRRVLFQTWNMGHIAIRGATWLLSDAVDLNLIDSTGRVTPILAHGMVGDDYGHQVKANIDPSGRIATYMTNNGTARQDVYLLVL